MHKTKFLGVMAALAVALMMIGCETATKVTGGGSVDPYSSYTMTDKASFGFNGTSCDGTINGQFQFTDMSIRIDGGVKFHATVNDAYICEDPYLGTCGDCASGDIKIEADYDSTNPQRPGSGQAIVCLTDGGEGGNADAEDTVFVKLYDGPFNGYSVGGVVRGNVQDHGCEEE